MSPSDPSPTAAVSTTAPVFAGDFWSDEVILDPYPIYDQLRDLGPVVWFEKQRCWAATRYDSVKQVLLSPQTFSSAHGCMMNEAMNTASQGVMLCSDDPRHLELRRLFAKPLLPKALAEHRPRFEALARQRIGELLKRERFDAVRELAHFLPLSVVTELVGLDEEGKAHMLDWAAGLFNAFGPEGNARTLEGMAIAEQAIGYVMTVDRNRLAPDGWGAALFRAADAGTLTEITARNLLLDYLGPALDTTINATSAMIELFALNPDQWEAVQANPKLISGAINEAIRLESPIRAFSRYVLADTDFAGTTVREGDRMLALYACANRDPRHYPDAGRFDVARGSADHLGFGQGTHVCAGMHLAKLEMSVLVEAMIPTVAGFKIHASERRAHNTLRGLLHLETTFVQS